MAKSSDYVLIVCKAAKATVYGYKGAMFPSDDTGEEATPTWALTGILSNILLQMFRSLSELLCVHTR
jgi:hypothetical protein